MPTPAIQKVVPLTIPITSGFSQWANLQGFVPIGILMPSSWDAANIVVRGRPTPVGNGETATYDSTGGTVYDDLGTQISIVAAASRYIRFDERLFQGCRALAFSADGQSAPRSISLVVRDESQLIYDGL